MRSATAAVAVVVIPVPAARPPRPPRGRLQSVVEARQLPLVVLPRMAPMAGRAPAVVLLRVVVRRQRAVGRVVEGVQGGLICRVEPP
eukprot:276022-Prorocentrum_minimum.AAC.1